MRNILYSMTWLSIWLLLMLPVVAAQQFLTVQKFAGADNVEGFAKENDELAVQILAQMLGNPTPDVARQRARVYYRDTYSFMDTCVAQAGAMYQCAYKTQDLIYGGQDEYAVKLFDAENNELAAVSKILTVDFLAPKVVTFSVSPNMSSQAVPVTVAYKAEDYGTTTGETTNCAGIKFINITANNAHVGLISANVSTCTKEGTFTFTPTVSGPSARVTVCAVATDHLNHKSLPACRDVFIDSQKPTATALELRDQDRFVITHARTGQQVTADVSVRIPDVDVDPTTVYADLSKLNPALGKSVANDQSADWFIWRSVPVTSPSTCEVTVEATDFMGNKDAKRLTCAIGIDDSGPEPLSIATRFVDEDNLPVLGVEGTIVVALRETGSGLDKANAFLDLRQLGIGIEVKANTCEKTATDTWKCSWNVRPTVPSGVYPVRVLPTTRDDLDNQATATPQQNIRFDNTAPSNVRLKEIAAFRDQQRVRTNVTVLGETVEFVVEGAGFTTAVADLRSLGGRNATPAEHCTGNLTRTCTFGITTAVSGPQGTNVTFTFSDVAGNTAILSTTELFILGVNNETAPNYWMLTTDCSPTLLDRQTLSVFEHPVYCRLRMTSTNPQARVITVQGPVDFTQCTGQTDYISTFSIENNYGGSTEPYLVLNLVATDYAINDLTFTCPVSTLTRVGNFVPQNFEHDNATVTLQFHNLPLGELHQNVKHEVGDVKDKIKGVWKVIGELQKYADYAEKFCKLLYTIINIVTLIANVMVLLNIAQVVANAVNFGIGNIAAQNLKETQRALCNPVEQTRQLYNDNLLGEFKKFCDFLTCQSGLFDVMDSLGIMDKPTGTGYGDFVNNWIGGFGLSESIGLSGTSATIAGQETTIQNPNAYLNVKDSLVYSIVVPPLCIPGIIYNLDKWRQIECRYGLCLLDDVRHQGLPTSACKDQKHYQQCRYVVGEIFNLIPFAPIVNYYLNIIQQALSDPLVLVGIGLAFLLKCDTACKAEEIGFGYYACTGLNIASQLGQATTWVKNIKSVSDIGQVGNKWCEEFEDTLEDFEAET